ncbi:MAG: PolC-type DNA polymerase III [Oscillibacter sp.]|jgi:DNA polymerase-3 subunit alpha (Gram-positive type)|nr:PolC-type DNA polymerase III [Oscillibacter sp.]
MANKIPFFKMFADLLVPHELKTRLCGGMLDGVVIDREQFSIDLRLTTDLPLDDGELRELEGMIAATYGFSTVHIQAVCAAPAPAPEKKPEKSGKKAPAQKVSEILLGSKIKGRPVPMNTLNLKMGNATVAGKVFSADCRETRRPGMWRLSFDMTDYTNSVTVQKNLTAKEAETFGSAIQPGMWLLVQGKMEPTWDNKDIQLNPYHINRIEHKGREDTADAKRVELHLHTQMSNMDALTDTGAVIREAIRWGHRAIAITDHGVAQSFPDAARAAGDKIKVLYGMEGYFVNNLDDRIAVHGSQDCPLTGEFVCFDIETTGLKVDREAITEIGAVVLKDGEICQRFQTFVNPNRKLTPEIIGLTGITDDMLKDAPQLKEALTSFLSFAGDRPLAAHNAEFDIGFIREGCRKVGLPFHPTYVDSLILAQNLLPELNKYKLDVVAEALDLPAFNHHRASDDGATVGYMLIPFWKMLAQRGVTTLQAVNGEMEKLRPRGSKSSRFPKHIILLARNKVGLKNLYQLISLSNLKYFKRVPTIPKSELVRHREGLIIGSACEAGELFRAIEDHKDWDELRRIASFYDYLEIQPLCNNEFLLREGAVRDREDLRNFNRTVVKLGEELGKPVCATGDVHFQEPEDEVYRHILLASKKFADADAPLPIYFKTTDEMLREFSYLGEEKALEVVVTNPNAIADACETIELLPAGRLFPPRLANSRRDLENLVWGRAHELYGDPLPEIVQKRLDTELGGILKRGYDVIYMSAQKLVQGSLENGYLVGSRGSVGSSLVAYMAGITEVNALAPHYRCPKCRHSEFILDHSYGCGVDMPDKDCPVCGTRCAKEGFDIPFETFLGFGGDKVPDIDLNFSGEYQARAHRHAVEMFGKTQVFRAGTIGTLAEKTAYGYVKKYLEENGIAAGRAEENRLTLGCVGVRRTTGQHPGGLVVVPDDLDIEDFCPVQHPADSEDSDTITTHFEYHCMEDNLLKLDMLGHDDPTMIRMLENLTGVNPREIPLDDPDTMSIFTSSKVLGFENDDLLGPTGAVAIPEFNTRFTRGMLVDTKPQNFNTLVRLSGFSHGTDVWLGNARELIVGGTASVLETVGCRDDIMLYLIAMGIDAKTSFKIMEAVRKGKVKKSGFQDGWVDAMHDHQVPDWYIESLSKIGYLFPKAHAVAYVTMAYRIAWFKVHEPLAFYATYFSIRAKAFDAEICCAGLDAVKKKIREIENNKDATAVEQDLMTTLEVCYEFYLRGFHFEPISIYRSDAVKFLVVDGGLLPPFTSVHGLGEAAALDTVEKRKGKQFISIEEFSMCCSKLSKTHIEQLKSLGAFANMAETSQLTLF